MPQSHNPFTLHVPDADIEDLKARLAPTRLPDQAPNSGWEYGADLSYMRRLLEYWRTTFDWRAQEAKLNAFPQFKVPLAGIDVHYLHVPGSRARSEAALASCSQHSWHHVECGDLVEQGDCPLPSVRPDRSLLHPELPHPTIARGSPLPRHPEPFHGNWVTQPTG